jgi:hypothetical protein
MVRRYGFSNGVSSGHNPLVKLRTLVAALFVVGCGGSTPATPPPTEAPPAETTTPLATAATGFAPDSIISVIEGPLRVRSKPSVDADSEKFTPLLETGQRLFVISGPAQGSGYNGYLVRPVAKRVTQDGWISAGSREGVPWVEQAAVDCPSVTTLADINKLDRPLRILCYGGKELTFTTTIYWGGLCADSSALAKPDWMDGCLSTFRWGAKTTDVIVAVPPELQDKVGNHDEGDSFKAKVTAHLDDPGALTCEPKSGLAGDPVIVHSTVELDCRAMFVATSFEKL